jgi:hypothetical protein
LRLREFDWLESDSLFRSRLRSRLGRR